MKILPVLDLLGGEVVRGVAGRREEYRPVRSCLTDSSKPLAVARAFRTHLQLDELYVADLDAILGREPDFATWSILCDNGFRLWIDAGIRSLADARRVMKYEVRVLVVGLETLASPQALADIAAEQGSRMVFSLDLHEGRPLANPVTWGHASSGDIAVRAVELGVRRLLVLDLSQVGVGTGTCTEELCSRLACRFPHLELIAGGGIRGMPDIQGLQAAGVSTVLLASTLHDGRITRTDLVRLKNSIE